MCGIFGFYSLDDEDPDLINNRMQTMCRLLKHRGPDDDGYFTNNHVGIGNTRLSILGLTYGHQPMFSEDGSIVVVQNGEIYNYIELQQEVGKCQSQCDTEIILKLYEKHGPQFISKLNGMFAIAIYDKKIDTLFLYRDRVGVKPLFVYDEGHTFFFSSEIKPILHTNPKFSINYEALDSLMTFNYILPPKTIYEGINHLQPGSCCTINKKGVIYSQWWDLADISPIKNFKEKESVEKFQNLIKSSVELRLRSDVPCGAFLSGGIDSSTIVACMSQIQKNPINTFTIGFNDKRYDESEDAEVVARRFNTIFRLEKQDYNIEEDWKKVIYHCEQPHGDVSFIPTLLVSKLAKKNDIKVILTGDGGDELFAGYDKYQRIVSGNQFLSEFTIFPLKEKRSFYKETLEPNNFNDIIQHHCKRFTHQDPLNRILAFDTLYLLPGNNLVKPDRMGMSVGVEARTPFLDYRIIEFAFTLPGLSKLSKGITKYIYKKAVERWICVDTAYRKKQMFTVPIGEWFKTSLHNFVKQTLNDKNSFLSEVFNVDYINKIFSMHCNNMANYTREIRLFLALQLWWEQFGIFCKL